MHWWIISGNVEVPLSPFFLQRCCKVPKFVVEITVFPFVQTPNGNMELHPIYEDEEERCYFRRRASVQAVSDQANKDWDLVCFYVNLLMVAHENDESRQHFPPCTLFLF